MSRGSWLEMAFPGEGCALMSKASPNTSSWGLIQVSREIQIQG